MRALLWLLLLAALATGLAVAARYNDGYALLVMPPWRVELSLNLLLFLLLAACVAAYFLLHGIAAIMRMPAAVSAYRAKRARAKADSALRDAVLCWQEGRFSQAIKSAEQSFDAGHARGLAALIALRAAHGLRDESREALWRQRALDNETGVRAARLKAEVELALDNHDFGLARDLLKQLLDEGGRHIALLRLSLRIHQGLGDWTEVLRLTRQLQKHKALTAEQAAPLRLRAHRENLAALAGDGEQLLRYWKSMADDDRREARVDPRAPLLGRAAQRVVDLERALGEQEQAAEEQDQVPPGHAESREGDERLGEAREPDDREQQRDPREHREREAADPRRLLALGRQPPDQDRDEDDVVDAEDDLQRRQRQECDPGARLGQQRQHDGGPLRAFRRWRRGA